MLLAGSDPISATTPVIGGMTSYGSAGGQAPFLFTARANVYAVPWATATPYVVGNYVLGSDGFPP